MFPGRIGRHVEEIGRRALVLLLAGGLTGAVVLTASAYEFRGQSFEPLEWERIHTLDRAEFLPDLNPPRGAVGGDTVQLGDGAAFRYGVGLNMNRVDGFSLIGVQELRNKPWLPGFAAYEAYGFSSYDWSGALETRILLGTPKLSVAGRWFDETSAWPLPVQVVRAKENFAAALFLRDDYMDYLRRRGGAAVLEWADSPGRGVQLVYSKEEHDSMKRARGRIGPFGGDERFEVNPPVDEGDWDILRVRGIWALSAGQESWENRSTHVFLTDAQASGGELGGEREFVRFWAEQRGRQRLTPSQFFGYRLAGGWTPRGTADTTGSRLPAQWQFQAGGVGSLRAHEYQAFRGDRIALFTAEYGLVLDEKVRPVLFLDGGKAWNQVEDRSGGIGGSGPLALDGGLGFQLGEGPTSARLDIARNLRMKRSGAAVSFRVSMPY